jgi:hypothetical protein
MGSSGSGRLTDYPGSGKAKSKGAGGDGPLQSDRCARAFSTSLEDVEHCTYHQHHKSAPPVGTSLHIALQKRLVALTNAGEVVGSLPTQFNYLAACLEAGYGYVGQVRDSSNGPPAATVAADFAAVAPK